MWKGTAAILKQTPAATNTMPSTMPSPAFSLIAETMPGNETVPVKP